MNARLSDTVRARVDHKTKTEAEEVLDSIGMDMSDAIRLFIKQIASRREFPLELRVPNAVTIEAMNATVEDKSYDSASSLFNEILDEQADDTD